MKTKWNVKRESGSVWAVLFGIMLVASFARFFYGITSDNFTFLDEYTTFDTAAGFFHTGKFNHWDFHYNTLSDYEYTRAWPHTILLALWFKVFGLNVVAGKTLSVVFGVLFIASLFYITWKVYHNYYITVLSCFLVMANETVVTVFRQIRMYSLWLLIMTWLAYFAYQVLTVEPQTEYKSRIGKRYQQYFNFSPVYIGGAVFLLLLGYFTHVNTLALGVGVIVFFLYCLIRKKEKRYYSALALAGGIVLLLLLVIVCVMPLMPELNVMNWWTVVKTQVAGRGEINTRYWRWISTFIGSKAVFYVILASILFAFVKYEKKDDNAYEFSVYALSVVVSALLFFMLFLSRYYAARYMLYVAPLLTVLMAWGIVETVRIIGTKWADLAATVAVLVYLAIYMAGSFQEVYDSDDIVYHREAYEILKEDAAKEMAGETIPIVEFDFRDYYAVQVLDDYVSTELDRTDEDMETLKCFAEIHPDGYVLVETDKVYGFADPMKNFIHNHSERVAGEGLDDYNIETVRYHFVNPDESLEEIKQDDVRVNGPVTYYFTEDGESTRIRLDVDLSMLDKGADILFLNFGIFTVDKETEDRCYQLLLPESGIGSYEIIFDKACIEFLLKDECMIYLKDKTCREKMLYEK